MSLEKMFAETDARRERDAERAANLDSDECQLCGAYGADKRTLIIRYFYAIHEVVPEAIDLSGVGGKEDRGYMLRTCKTCRGEFLDMMAEWRNRRVARREVPKDHDGEEWDGGEGMIPYRHNGHTIWLTEQQWRERRANEGTP